MAILSATLSGPTIIECDTVEDVSDVWGMLATDHGYTATRCTPTRWGYMLTLSTPDPIPNVAVIAYVRPEV